MLGAEQRPRRARRAGGQRAMDGTQVAGHRGGVGEQAIGPPAQLPQPARRGEQPVEAGADHAPRRYWPLWPPLFASSRRSVMTTPRSIDLTMS